MIEIKNKNEGRIAPRRKIKIFERLEDCPPKSDKPNANRFVDIEGGIYNSLKVLYYVWTYNKRAEWLCECLNCGRYVVVNSHNLRTGHTKTCGCAISESLREDLTNQVFGKLKVIEYDKSVNESPYWIVKCLNCGKIYSVSATSLKSGGIESCGCMKASKREQIIKKELQTWAESVGREFETEKTFDDCVFKAKLRFDFYLGEYYTEFNNKKIFNSQVLMEYDGQQHYHPVKFRGISDSESYKRFITTQITDWLKDLYCITKDISLVRIRYSNKRHPDYKQLYKNSYIVGKAQASDKMINVFDINNVDLVNYKKSTFNIASGISCTFKCGREICQNSELSKKQPIKCNIDDIIKRYLNQNISRSITFQGLEVLDNLKQLLWFIYYFRKQSSDTIIIWTGYTKEECSDLIYLIQNKMKWENIIIKFGRFLPGHEKHYDEVLGVELASPNQHAERIS